MLPLPPKRVPSVRCVSCGEFGQHIHAAQCGSCGLWPICRPCQLDHDCWGQFVDTAIVTCDADEASLVFPVPPRRVPSVRCLECNVFLRSVNIRQCGACGLNPLCRQCITNHFCGGGTQYADTTTVETQRPQRIETARSIEAFSFLLLSTALATRVEPPSAISSSSTGHAAFFRKMSASTPYDIETDLLWWPFGEEIMQFYLNQPNYYPEEVCILSDTGAHDGLCSHLFARQQAAHATTVGRRMTQTGIDKPRTVAGMGHGQPVARFEVCLPASIMDIHGQVFEEEYRAPCAENSGIPGLMVIQSLECNNALIRCRTGEIYFLGEGGADIQAPLGSRHFQLKKGKTEHGMIPIINFSDQHNMASIVLNTSSHSSSSTGVSLQQ